MNNKLSVAVALAAGLTGALLTRYIAPPPVFAQAPAVQAPTATAPVTNELRARSFTLVDQFDHAVGTFTAESSNGALRQNTTPVRIVLRDSNGKEIWSAGGSALRPAFESLK